VNIEKEGPPKFINFQPWRPDSFDQNQPALRKLGYVASKCSPVFDEHDPLKAVVMQHLFSGKISPFVLEVIKILQAKYDRQGMRCFGKKFI
jgi:hypothetical protein